MSSELVGDGSSPRDAEPVVEIDTTDETQAWQWRCPNGHSTIEPTNGGVWCRSCANDHNIDDPHHYELLNAKTEETVAWSRVVLR